MYGMPPGMDQLLRQKYAILQQQADSGTTAANAAARLDTARARVIPAESEANIAATNAGTAFTKEQTKYFGPTALANIDLTKAQTGRTGAETRFILEGQLPESLSRSRLNDANSTSIGQINRMFDVDEARTQEIGRGLRGYVDMVNRQLPRVGRFGM